VPRAHEGYIRAGRAAELEQIYFWIAKDNPRAAAELLGRIEDKVLALVLPGFAHMGRPGLVNGTRELIEFPYIVVSRIDEDGDEIVVLSVVHGARKREAGNEKK
jgi:toxin ParE1/3/4